MGLFLDSLKEKYVKSSYEKFTDDSNKWFSTVLKNPDSDFVRVNLNNLKTGKFYFMMYDLAGKNKSSKLEKYSFIFLNDYKIVKTKQFLYATSINFIPLKIRLYLFDKIFSSYSTTYKDNLSNPKTLEQSIFPTTYDKMYKLLQSIGYEYSIREFDISLIDRVYMVSTSKLAEFLSLDTSLITNVPEEKMFEIWKAKLYTKAEDERERLQSVLKNWEEIEDTITIQTKEYKNELDNLNKSIVEINQYLKKL